MRGVRKPFPTIPTLTSQNGRTALHHACEKGNNVAVVEVLIDKHGANVEAVDKVRSGGIRTCMGGYDVSWATAVPVFTTCLPSSELFRALNQSRSPSLTRASDHCILTHGDLGWAYTHLDGQVARATDGAIRSRSKPTRCGYGGQHLAAHDGLARAHGGAAHTRRRPKRDQSGESTSQQLPITHRLIVSA